MAKLPVWAKSVADSTLRMVKAKDPFTFYHCCRVGRAARRLAKAMGMNEFEQNVVEFSGLFHDVGKVGISDAILLKPGRLTTDEHNTMKSHAEISADILRPFAHDPFFRFILPGVRYHHERVDGLGYPNRLSGEDIPINARIVAVVDCVDAMTNTRPYRQALSMEAAKQELIDYSGSQFDAQLVKIYLEALPTWDDIEADSADEVAVTAILKSAA